MDKFLSDIQLEFRDKYKQEILNGEYGSSNFSNFRETFDRVLRQCEEGSRAELNARKAPRPYQETEKAMSKVSSMIEKKTDLLPFGNLLGNSNSSGTSTSSKNVKKVADEPSSMTNQAKKDFEENLEPKSSPSSPGQGKMRKFEKKVKEVKKEEKPKGKQGTKWEGGDVKPEDLDFGKKVNGVNEQHAAPLDPNKYGDERLTGTKRGELANIDESEGSSEEDVEEVAAQKSQKTSNGKSGGSSFGLFSSLKSLVGAKVLNKETIAPIIEKMQELLVAKNVAMEISQKLCDNVATNLEGKQIGNFQFATSIVKKAIHESLVQILTPKKRINILRDIIDTKAQRRPYVIVFCGVNGVGKSTNLAKVTFWLIENSNRVLIAACDTFRSGAVEQLLTHTRHLNALHPPEAHNGTTMVELFQRGYGKDAAGIAMEAINHARSNHFDVVLVDTAGRMQDNEPLMKALAKLININQPDLVLFVGEALVGNEAVDQVKKFNQALYDNSSVGSLNEQARLIDGIVLTKFDTIDDKVGAAISMTYTTGKPIVFVGTGQTYADLKNLNAEAVAKSLLK